MQKYIQLINFFRSSTIQSEIFDRTKTIIQQFLQQQKPMQPNISSPHIIRSSYGFPIQQQYSLRSPQNKGLSQQQQVSYFPLNPNHQESLSVSIKNLEARIDNVESPGRKKLANYDGSTALHAPNDSRFRPQYQNNNQLRAEESVNDQFLRGSCSNVLKKFEQSNLTSSLRNTTHFNIINKFPTSPMEMRKQPQQPNPFKNSNASKGGTQSTSSSGTYLQKPAERKRANQPMSKTPTKLFVQKKLDQSVKVSSNKTPIKYKNVIENSNKNSGISKASNDADQKKTFKSLNEIIQCKNKQKLAIQKIETTMKHSKLINGFELGSTLGKGKFGEVFLGRHHTTGFIGAIKKIVKGKVLEYKMLDQLCTQIRLHSCLDHPNIVKFYGFFEQKENIYLVIEYMNGGTLFDYLNQVTCLPVRQTVEYLRDIIEAIVYMHEKSIAHRDIKPENIVICSEGVAKLCDFGWSALVQTSRKTYCGTFDYAPPQILERKSYDASVDIWCIGVLTYQLLVGRVPFQGDQRNVVMQKIVNVDKNKISYPANIPIQAKQFIEALMQKDPNLRPKSQDLLKFRLFSLYPKIGSKSTAPPKRTT